jgi:ribosome-associated protein
MSDNSDKLAKLIVQAAQNKKATRLVMQDLRGSSDLCDIQFVCSADNDRQTKAIAEEIQNLVFAEMRLKPISVEGKQTGNWVLIDFGSVMAHVFFNPMRDYYALERLWPKAKFIELSQFTANS